MSKNQMSLTYRKCPSPTENLQRGGNNRLKMETWCKVLTVLSGSSPMHHLWSADSEPGLISPYQCWATLILLWLNVNKSLQPGLKMRCNVFSGEWKLLKQRINVFCIHHSGFLPIYSYIWMSSKITEYKYNTYNTDTVFCYSSSKLMQWHHLLKVSAQSCFHQN